MTAPPIPPPPRFPGLTVYLYGAVLLFLFFGALWWSSAVLGGLFVAWLAFGVAR